MKKLIKILMKKIVDSINPLYVFLTGMVVLLAWLITGLASDINALNGNTEEAEYKAVEIVADELDVTPKEILLDEGVFYTPKGNYKAKFSTPEIKKMELISLYKLND